MNNGLLRLKQVLEIVPVSRANWWVGVRSGRFPKSFKLGPRTTVWKKSDIEAFIDSLDGNKE